MSDSAGEVLYDAIQSTHDTDEELEGAVLIGFVTVAEWSDPKGDRWLSTITRSIEGKAPPQWTVKGWLHDALFDPVVPSEDDEDE